MAIMALNVTSLFKSNDREQERMKSPLEKNKESTQ